jgi:hypothetical protein
MGWCHSVNKEWLAARKKFLTASDIMKLIPTTPTGRPRSNMDEAYLKVWAEKQSEVSFDDINSSGVMARGHLMEPYAVELFNKRSSFKLHHWDNTLIYSPDGVSASPDALDIPQPEGCPVSLAGADATFVSEIKAYGPGAHYEKGTADKMTLEERWQLATAMYVMPSIKSGQIIFFNPSARHPFLNHVYGRAQLANELEMIEEIVKKYLVIMGSLEKQMDARCPEVWKENCPSEQEIWEKCQQALAP